DNINAVIAAVSILPIGSIANITKYDDTEINSRIKALKEGTEKVATDYQKTKNKVLLVPGCMRINNGKVCKAKQDGFDITCTSCNKNCKIYELTNLGNKNKFSVNIVPHSSSFTKWLKKWENNDQTGLIAVACLLNLVPGGYEMRELNIPAQCLLLDFCGCKKHWHKNGIATEINEDRLLKMLN
ncbi:MAG: DUF116 domain-containing protein, partial [Bacteroidales bacterium]|nr:DUF116 domain-containing protein [Bacteroidales bacterium]